MATPGTPLNDRQLTGLADDHLIDVDDGHCLQPDAARALQCLQRDAADAGFMLAIASSFRSFERQLAIWNGKACGERPVHDSDGCAVDMAALDVDAQRHAILRYSALPGASRHHWGTDLDVFDAAAVEAGYRVQLTPEEVGPGGVFDAMHQWLDDKIARGESHGFFRPYAIDRGGVAPERWHLSYAPIATQCAARLTPTLLAQSWATGPDARPLLFDDDCAPLLTALFERYVTVPDEEGRA